MTSRMDLVQMHVSCRLQDYFALDDIVATLLWIRQE